MVSDKMVKAGLDSWAQFGKHQRDHKQVAQDIVNAAWHTFSPSDKETWPEYGVSCLVKCSEDPHGYEVCWFDNGTFYHVGLPALDPVEYALLADLMPQREDE